MFRVAVMALIFVWPSAAVAQPATDADIDRARADVARFCAAEIQTFVKASKAEANPDARITPEQDVIERFEHLLGQLSTSPDLNLAAYINKHAQELASTARDRSSDVWMKRILAEDRLRICIDGRAIQHFGEHATYVVVQNKTASTAKLMSGPINWGEMEPGETKLYRFARPGPMTFRIAINDVDTHGPTNVETRSGETLVLSFGDAGNALSVAQPPPQD